MAPFEEELLALDPAGDRVAATEDAAPAMASPPRKRPSFVVTAYPDLLQQAVSAMRHDLRRTLLTMAGMALGIATVVLVLAYGNGLAQAITNVFESFGATAVGIFQGRTLILSGVNMVGV